MQDPLFQLFADTIEHEPTATLHGRVMRRVILERYRRPALTLGFLLAGSFAASTVNLVVAAFNRDLHSIVQLAVGDFEWSQSYIADFSTIIIQTLPVRAVLVFVLNTSLALYTFSFARKAARSITVDLGSR